MLLEYVQLAEVSVSLLDRVQLMPYLENVNGDDPGAGSARPHVASPVYEGRRGTEHW